MLLAIAILAFQYKSGIIAPGQAGATWRSILWPYLTLFACFVLFHLLRSPWKLDQQSRGAQEKLRDEVVHRNQLLADSQATNARPEIHGDAFHFLGKWSGEEDVNGIVRSSADLMFELQVSNQRSVSTNVKRWEFDGSLIDPPIEFAEVSILKPGIGPMDMMTSDFELPMGKAVSLVGQATATLCRRQSEIGSIDLSNLKIRLVDGFNGSHLIQVRQGEKLLVKPPRSSIEVW
jgi:hypothetical protein